MLLLDADLLVTGMSVMGIESYNNTEIRSKSLREQEARKGTCWLHARLLSRERPKLWVRE